jgi:NTP pyrophosphatase (non-canonical NTP hydrolase)
MVEVSAFRRAGLKPVCDPAPMTVRAAFQESMDADYGARHRARGVPATVAWRAEEVGELAKAARKGTVDEQLHELGDVLAWLASLANQLGLSLDDAAARYASGCPRCGGTPCACP